MLYRIFTENKNPDGITAIVRQYFDGFTIFTAKGYWRHEEEQSLIIEIYSDAESAGYTVGNIAKEIKELCQQENILVQEIKCKAHLI